MHQWWGLISSASVSSCRQQAQRPPSWDAAHPIKSTQGCCARPIKRTHGRCASRRTRVRLPQVPSITRTRALPRVPPEQPGSANGLQALAQPVLLERHARLLLSRRLTGPETPAQDPLLHWCGATAGGRAKASTSELDAKNPSVGCLNRSCK
eukprot:288822-Chlamydomonas_euryale.AAC.1